MTINTNLASAVLAVSLLGATAVSQAGFVLLDQYPPDATATPISSANYFKDPFKAAGITHYTLGAMLDLNASGTVTYYYAGKEAGYRNDFIFGALEYSSQYDTVENRLNDLDEIGTVTFGGPGSLAFEFCAYSNEDEQQLGCLSNFQNDSTGMTSSQSIAMSIGNDGNTAWLFWDDGGSGQGSEGPDDNHDDMIIKAVFTPVNVPEPASQSLFGLGLLGLRVAARKQQRKTLKI